MICFLPSSLHVQFGKVHRGLWRMSEVAVKIIMVRSMLGCELTMHSSS